MVTKVSGTEGVDQVKAGTLTVDDAKSGQVVGFQKMQLFAAKATTSGTSVDFSPADGTGIPSWAKKITVMFNGVSTNGTSILQAQLGTSGGLVVTGYSGSTSGGSSGVVTSINSAGFRLAAAGSAAHLNSSTLVLGNVSGNIWIASVSGSAANTDFICGGGSVTLSGTLDRIRLTTVNGTDTFDAGSVNLLVEGYA